MTAVLQRSPHAVSQNREVLMGYVLQAVAEEHHEIVLSIA
jgi:hypothetical protein